MTIQTIQNTGVIDYALPVNTASIQTIFSNPGFNNSNIPTDAIINFNSFIKNLRAIAIINSVAEAPMPDFGLTDSDTEKLLKISNIEWNSPRKQLDLHIRSTNFGIWRKVFSLSLLNPMGYPFRVYNLLDGLTDGLALELGQFGQIGISITDVGHGLLTTMDSVMVHGSFLQEININADKLNRLSTCIPISTPVDNYGTWIFSNNPNRKYFRLRNNGNSNVWLAFGDYANVGTGILLKPNETWDYSGNSSPMLPLVAVSESTDGTFPTLTGMECS